jgi:hypothetical protein
VVVNVDIIVGVGNTVVLFMIVVAPEQAEVPITRLITMIIITINFN